MTLGLFLPLITALGALLAVPVFVWQLRRLPGPTEPGFEAVAVAARARALKIMIAAQIAIPLLMYLILNFILPAEGAAVIL